MDINGWDYGYAQTFFDAGITRFYYAIHNYFGFLPFDTKHNLFYWETENS